MLLGDEKTHPPSPLLLVLSSEGLIIPYYMVYLHKDAPALTQPGQALDTAGLRKPMGTVLVIIKLRKNPVPLRFL